MVKDFLTGEGCGIAQLTRKVPQENCGDGEEVENMNHLPGEGGGD